MKGASGTLLTFDAILEPSSGAAAPLKLPGAHEVAAALRRLHPGVAVTAVHPASAFEPRDTAVAAAAALPPLLPVAVLSDAPALLTSAGPVGVSGVLGCTFHGQTVAQLARGNVRVTAGQPVSVQLPPLGCVPQQHEEGPELVPPAPFPPSESRLAAAGLRTAS